MGRRSVDREQVVAEVLPDEVVEGGVVPPRCLLVHRGNHPTEPFARPRVSAARSPPAGGAVRLNGIGVEAVVKIGRWARQIRENRSSNSGESSSNSGESSSNSG